MISESTVELYKNNFKIFNIMFKINEKNRHLKKNSITEIPSETFIKLAQLRLLLVLNLLTYFKKNS